MRRVVIGFALLAFVVGSFALGYILGTHAEDRRVPNMLGLGTEDGGQAAARRALAAVDLRVGKVASIVCDSDERGLVVRQNPSPGVMVPAGATVNIGIGGAGIGLFGNPGECLPGAQTPAGLPNSP